MGSVVLVVDDTDSVRDFHAMLAKLAGATVVVERPTAEAAVEYIQQHGAEIAAVITDHNTESMKDGFAVLEAAKEQCIPAVMASATPHVAAFTKRAAELNAGFYEKGGDYFDDFQVFVQRALARSAGLEGYSLAERCRNADLGRVQ